MNLLLNLIWLVWGGVIVLLAVLVGGSVGCSAFVGLRGGGRWW